MPDEHPAITERVPVGAMVVTVALRRGRSPRAAGALVFHPGKGPRRAPRRSLSAWASAWTKPMTSVPSANACGSS
jgi:hypothetical protein